MNKIVFNPVQIAHNLGLILIVVSLVLIWSSIGPVRRGGRRGS